MRRTKEMSDFLGNSMQVNPENVGTRRAALLVKESKLTISAKHCLPSCSSNAARRVPTYQKVYHYFK
jgi:hypothetical protein